MWFVQQQGIGPGEQHPRQLHAPALPPGKCSQGLAQHRGSHSQIRGNLGGFGGGSITAGHVEFLVQTHIALHGFLLGLAGFATHLFFGAPDALLNHVQASHRKDMVAHQLFGVDFAGVLGQIPWGSRTRHLTFDLYGIGDSRAGKQPHQSGFPRAVSPHQTNTHTFIHLEGSLGNQDAIGDAQSQVGGGNHPNSLAVSSIWR